MDGKIHASDLKVLEVLWKEGDLEAKKIAKILQEKADWSRTTTYTIINRAIKKGLISKEEPQFLCHALVTEEYVKNLKTDELIEEIYKGSADLLVASILDRNKLSAKEINELKKMIDKMR